MKTQFKLLQSPGNIKIAFFIFLFTYLLIVMRNAFTVDFMLDDWFFLKIGKADNISDIVYFFSPFKDYFYRPIPTELFYLLINSTKQNLFLAHSIVFLIYFTGLVFLFRVSEMLSKSTVFSYIFVFIYAISYTHVFQLYVLNTFQEICLFTFLAISSYLYIKKKYLLSIIFFVFALMSKETAILFPILIFVYEILFVRKINKDNILKIIFSVGTSMFFIVIYKYAASQIVELDNYKIILNPNLIINNSIWYVLWSLGIPNFVPNYIQSIFFKPTPDFWNLLSDHKIRFYFYTLILYYSLLIPLTLIVIYRAKKNLYKLMGLLFLLGFLFFVFIAPTIPTIHRWIVRLTVPVLFTSAITAIIIYLGYIEKGFLRFISVFIVILYFVMSTLGIMIHEESSLYLMNSQTIKNFRYYLEQNEKLVNEFDTIYFVSSSKKDYGGSIELKNMLGSYYFTDTFFPNRNISIIYGHDQRLIPEHSLVIESKDIAEW